MYKNKKVSVVVSTYQEKTSLRRFINNSFATGFVDEVIVVNNNAEPGTDEEVLQTPARLIHETKQGYGYGFRRALSEATGDLIIMSEPDGTFSPGDFEKLLVYSDHFPAVFCTRTATYAILDGANMGLFLKWGNWAVAKMIEVIFATTQLSDVGCTTRLVTKQVLSEIERDFTIGSNQFGLEMILLIVQKRIPFVEIPVRYMPRMGVSAVTGNRWAAVRLGLQMILLSIRMRGRKLNLGPRPATSAEAF
jgi:glycosyltransferase involved in cell wall biosynthesis